jgi:hypothetical protein
VVQRHGRTRLREMSNSTVKRKELCTRALETQ